jgi:glucose-fructose oxidoreductase
VEKVAPRTHLLVEKPFATLGEADRMIAAAKAHRVELAINWPLRWAPAHVTAHRLLSAGVIGDLQEVHYYGGNRGPLRHGADKIETKSGPKAKSWFYQRKAGGGSLLDYLATARRGVVSQRRKAADNVHMDEPAGWRWMSIPSRWRAIAVVSRSSKRAGAHSLIRGHTSRSPNAASF